MASPLRSLLFALVLPTVAFAQAVETQHPRLALISYDPILYGHGHQRLHDYYGWHDPATEIVDYLDGMKTGSHGIVDERLTQFLEMNFWPIKADGFQYTEAQYLAGNWHMPDGVDYLAIARNHDLARRVDRGELDEVALYGAPYFGYWESTMAGYGGFYCNSGPQPEIASSKIFVIMGWNYERIVSLHATGHRAESIMTKVYGSWSTNRDLHVWDCFGWNVGQTTISSTYGVGSAHYPPNAYADYQYWNSNQVPSYAPDWLNNFPSLTGQTAIVDRNSWGATPNSFEMGFFIWWYQHMPHVAGRNQLDGYDRLNNWWEYIFDFNEHPESNGDHEVGVGVPLAATAWSASPTRITTDTQDDWAPVMNSAGRLAWYGSDGSDSEIYSANADGSDLVQITQNGYSDEAPRINASGQLVWQAFDGQDYEICTANADGTNIVQLTHNTVNDWHPDLSDSGRIVWDSWDGEDYEVHSADLDGSNAVQLTSNSHGGGVAPRRDDVWPRINASDRVVWSGHDGLRWQIYSADADGTGLVKITGDVYNSEFPEIGDGGKVVWQTWHGGVNGEIWSAHADGSNLDRLSYNAVNDWWPQVNAVGDVVWMQRQGGDWEIVRYDATSDTTDFVTAANSTHHQHPKLDDAGRVTWQGFDTADWEIYLWEGGVVYQVTDNDFDDRWPQLGGGGALAWHGESTPGAQGATTEIFAAQLEPGVGYCFGDPGSGTPCPCSNDNDGSIPGSGCDNGVFTSGAKLVGSGTASLSSDTLVLAATHLEPQNSGLYFQANHDLSPGSVWGDGLRCAGGSLKRLGVRFADAAGASDTSAWATSISLRAGNVVAGTTYYYQCWYRTTSGPPCGPGVNEFNSTNGYAVTWAP